MISRGPGFLAVVWFGASPTPASQLDRRRRHTGRLRKRDKLLTGEMDKGMCKEPNHTYNRQKALASINHSILSALWCWNLPGLPRTLHRCGCTSSSPGLYRSSRSRRCSGPSEQRPLDTLPSYLIFPHFMYLQNLHNLPIQQSQQ